MKNDNVGDQSVKNRKPKSREVNSRFLSPTSTSSLEIGNPSPTQGLSPDRRKPGSSFTDMRRIRSGQLDDSGSVRGLWPSSTTTTSSSSTRKLDTLADFLGNERLNDLLDRKNSLFDRQRSCREFSSKLENDKESAKENHRPGFGGSMRYSGKLRFPGKSSSSTSSSSSSSKLENSSSIVPGRLSVDSNALYQKLSRRNSDCFTDVLDSGSECSDACSSTDFQAIGKNSKPSSRKTGVEVSSKYMNDIQTRVRRGTSDSNIQIPISSDNSPKLGKFSIKNAIKRSSSVKGYGSSNTQWALSPGRSGSPPISVENKAKPLSFSSLKPPTSPSRTKGVEKLLNLGLELFKSKKSSSSNSLSVGSTTVTTEAGHQLRLLHNRLMQWRYANAKAASVNANIVNHIENNLLCACDGLTKLQQSVVYKKLQLEKEKLVMKLNFILHSQLKPLEAWGDMERNHLAAVSMTKECLHSVVCRVPLIDGAKINLQSTSISLRHASDLTSSINSMLDTVSPSAEKNVLLLSELADVVAQEKLLLEESLELLRTISILEIQERSLKSSIIQMEL
ncbi:QWRF motif-containing protein 3 [Ziziphus jujuba]|uniref:QWRF motif-containing protein 3 n=1 Tax=Ziziphus jujuba TaxID=326968 RepID=A0A6P3ZNG6_ZIZJJ|nr:QWRF motif-containing protein 3 [Ziziphus jujuba]